MAYSGDQKREYQRQWIAARRAEFFQDKACRICGSIERLELDHIDRTKKVSHRIWSWSWERILLEASKCQVLCYNHHLEKTRKEWLELAPPHGTNSRYTTRTYRCRCNLCKKAHAEANAKYRNGEVAQLAEQRAGSA